MTFKALFNYSSDTFINLKEIKYCNNLIKLYSSPVEKRNNIKIIIFNDN